MGVAGGGLEAPMTEQDLDGPDIGPLLEQVGGEAVPQGPGFAASSAERP
jgi:hypothetical protein